MIKNRNNLRENITGYLFILPNLIGLAVLVMYSLGYSLFISFTDWNLIGGLGNTKFVGFDNYKQLLTDELFWTSLYNNFWFLLVVPVETVLALMLAIALNEFVFGRKFLRVIYFLPYITNMAAILIVWHLMFNPQKGPVNLLLGAIGIKNPPTWLLDEFWSKPTVALFGIWTTLGFYMLVYLAGLQSIPKELYESAEIDGAGPFKRFINITVPLVSPTTFFIVIMSVLKAFQQWSNIQILTEGGPGDSTYVLGYYIYKLGFNYYRMGYASAIAWVFFAIVVIITLIQWKAQKKWVHY
ncbi:carbohydrate ABC transporter permease [Paenibacillus eucommiae]|uniref:Multiple sugar transport system permease protein n=1 Tax=Paenibacillus eucommiae TaxID=1355755 RepID=A0ABS4IUH5_9BACL|nr:sugar ABC transporter permease [Paenibacillus eucommiae]MBP1990661.1 multiple sugar transport system permease protein [Paenibacillus eucommiae]